MKLLLPVLVISILLLQVFAEASSFGTNAANSLSNMDGGSNRVALSKKHHHHYHHSKINCNYACARRCKKASRKKICRRACKTCCDRCKCVPPGTYGNKGACPCYASLKTHGHKPKCP